MLIVLMSLVESSILAAFQAVLQNQERAAGLTSRKDGKKDRFHRIQQSQCRVYVNKFYTSWLK